MSIEDAANLLDELRTVPPVGAWAVLNSAQNDDGEWVPDGTRPDEWHHTRAQAEAGAKRRLVPTCIGKVVAVENGWSIGEVHEVSS